MTIAALRDITERKQAEAERERAIRSREEVLSLLSHDLQNSVNALVLNAQLLLRIPAESERELPCVNTGSWSAGRRFDGPIDPRMLDVQQIEQGRFRIEARPEPVIPLVHEAIEPLQALADQRSVPRRAAGRLGTPGLLRSRPDRAGAPQSRGQRDQVVPEEGRS